MAGAAGQFSSTRSVSRIYLACILSGVEDPFDFRALRIRQPGKLLPNRANYEIFNADRQLLATATETEGRTRLKLPGKQAPGTRAIAVTTTAGEPVGFLINQSSEWITEFRDPGGELIGSVNLNWPHSSSLTWPRLRGCAAGGSLLIWPRRLWLVRPGWPVAGRDASRRGRRR
jgi:hypothetical protein